MRQEKHRVRSKSNNLGKKRSAFSVIAIYLYLFVFDVKYCMKLGHQIKILPKKIQEIPYDALSHRIRELPPQRVLPHHRLYLKMMK